jgi:transcriptional regulator with XRE-family HTH domain
MADSDPLFGKRLEDKMKLCKIKKKTLAEIIGVSPSAVGRYINEGRIPEAPILLKIAHTVNISMEWLLTGSSSNKTDLHKEYEVYSEQGEEIGPGAGVNNNTIITEKKYTTEIQPVLEAFVEVMTSNHEGVKLALTQNTYMFQETVRNAKEIEELKRDMNIIKKRLLNPREDDFKTQELKGEKKQGGGGNGEY